MALLIRLPLNGNLNNIGLNNDTFTGMTTYVDGKLGKCLSGSKVACSTSTVPASITTNNVYSVSIWMNYSGTDQCWLYSFGSGTGTMRGIWLNPGGLYWAYSGSGHSFSNVSGLNDGEWHHIAVTTDGSKAYSYVDGVYKSTLTPSKTDKITGTDVTLNLNTKAMMLNDFRVYDHCLSPREVKEISKGLVVHYKLDGPIENLAKGTATLVQGSGSFASGTWRNSGTGSCTYNTDMGIDAPFSKGVIITPSTANTEMGFCQDTAPIKAGNLTVSFWVKAPAGGTVRMQPFWKSGVAGMSPPSGAHATSWTTTGEWQFVYTTYTPTVDYDSTSIAYIYYKTATVGQTCYVCGCKLEYGLYPSPWMPNSADTEYAAMGYNDEIEPDVSGYGYNATKIGTFSSVADTAKYSSCYVFGGSNYIKMDPSLYQTMRLARDEVTVSIWAYRDNWKDYATSGSSTQWDTMFSCQEAGGFTIYETTLGSFTFVIGTGSSSNTYKTAGVGNAYAGNLSAGWHHFALTYNGLDLKGYIDGNLVKTTNCYTTKTQIWYYTGATTVFIGAEASSGTGAPVGGYYWRGRLSDFRVYETALSDTDIKELYNTPVSIANNGAMLVAGEIVEV